MADNGIPVTSIKIEATADTSKAEASIKRLAEKLNSLSNAANGGMTKRNGGKTTQPEEATRIDRISSSMRNLGTAAVKAGSSVKDVETGILRFDARVRKSFATVGKGALKVASAMGNAAASAAKMTVGFALSPWKRLASSIGSVVKRMGSFLAAAKRIAVYRAIRWALKELTQAFKEGIANLYQYSKLIEGQFAKSMDMLATSALYVKDSLAAMVAPLINNLAPAIDMIADKFVDLLNTVNESLAAMTGQDTWTAALKYPIEYAEAADDATKSAKKLRNTLLGFDEINRLDDKKKGKKSSGNDTLDYLKMFEERKVNTKAKSFFKTLKDAFKTGDMTDIGESIGKAISGGLDKIPWDSIEAKIKRNASSVATLLNGLISVDGLGTKIGASIAKAFNLAIAKMNTFFNTVNWGGIGTFLADGVNGIVHTFDIEGLGANLAGIINSAANVIDKFSDTVKWESIGTFLASGITSIFKNFRTDPPLAQSIAKVLNGGVTALNKFVNDVEWNKIGTFLGDNVNSFLKTFEIENLGKTIASVINKGVGAIFDFIDTVEWADVGRFISDGVNSFFDELNTKKIGETISESIVGAIVAVKEFFTSTDFQAIGNKIGEVLKEIDWGEALKGLASIIINALGASIDLLKGIWEKSPLLGVGFGVAFANLIATAVGAPSIASIIAKKIGSIVGTAVASEAASTAAAGAVGSTGSTAIGAVTASKSGGILGASVTSLPVTVVAIASAAAGVIGYSIGQFIDSKIPGVANFTDNLMEWLLGKPEGKVVYDDTDSKTFGTVITSTLGGGNDSTIRKLFKEQEELAALTAKFMPLSPTADLEQTLNGIINWDDIVSIDTSMVTVGTNTKDAADAAKTAADAAKNTDTKLKTVKDYIDSIKSGATSQSLSSIVKGSTSSKTNVVKGFASGGTPTTGSLFLAGEAGAELVSASGSHTSVYNRDQIANSVAVGNEEGNSLLRDLVNIGNKLLAKDTNVVTQITTGQIASAMNRQNIREGTTVVPVALGG